MNARTVFRNETQVTSRDGDDALMTYQIGATMSTTLLQGDAVVCFVTGSRRRRLEDQLIVRGIDVVGALMREQLVCVNALDTLMKVNVDGVPDVIRFAELIGAVLDRAATRYPHVLTFSELASVSCKSGDEPGALALEALWTSFVESRPVFFRCRSRPIALDPSATPPPAYRSIKRLREAAALVTTGDRMGVAAGAFIA